MAWGFDSPPGHRDCALAFAQYPRDGVGKPRRAQRFFTATDDTPKRFATVKAELAQTIAASTSVGGQDAFVGRGLGVRSGLVERPHTPSPTR